MASTEEIENALSDMRSAIEAGRFQPVPRRKNMYTLAMLGISWEDAKSELCGLTASDYFQGPEMDRDFPGTDLFWVFKKNIGGQVIYIKFKIVYLQDGGVKLVSFHLDHI